MGLPEPIGAQGTGAWSRSTIGHRRIPRGNVAGYLIPPMVDLVTQTKVYGQVWTQFKVVLSEHLRALQARSVLGTDTCAPIVDITQQEIGVLETASGDRAGNPGGV